MNTLRKTATQKVLAMLLTVALLVTFLPGGLIQPLKAKAAPTVYDVSSGPKTIAAGSGDWILTGSITNGAASGDPNHYHTPSVLIAENYTGTITLRNLSIINNRDMACIWLKGNNNNAAPNTKVNFLLEGSNTLSAGRYYTGADAGADNNYSYYPALFVETGAQISIDGAGSLTASTQNVGGNNRGGTSAIGGGGRGQVPLPAAPYSQSAGGNIHIKGGTIKAYGSVHGSAIGGGITQYDGYVVVSGGTVTAVGGVHGAGIGGGCANTGAGSKPSGTPSGSGIVAVLPPGSVSASGGSPSTKYLVGNVGSAVYIGDPNSPKVTVKTSENTKNADIYMDLRNITDIVTVLGKLGVPTSTVDPAKIWFANTGADGLQANLRMESGAANKINFFTEVDTSIGLKFLAVEQAITGAPTTVIPITLPAPIFSFTATPAGTPPALTYGYTSVPAANTITVTVTNTGNSPVAGITSALDSTYASLYTVSALSKTRLEKGESATLTITPKLGLSAGNHTPSLVVSGSGVSGTGASETLVPMTPTNVPLAMQVVNKATVAGKGETLSASPAPDALYHNYTSLNLTTSSTTTDSTVVSWKYAYTNSATTPTSGWVNKTGPASNVAAPIPASPADGDYYLHWEIVNSNYTNTSGVISVYKLDRTVPTVSSITTTVPGAGTGNFDVNVKFSENVSDLAASGLTITNAAVQSIVRKPATQDEFIVTLKANTGLTNGQQIKVQVNAAAVTDKASNPNTASLTTQDLNIYFNTAVPTAAYSFTANQLFAAEPGDNEIQITLTPNGAGDQKLYKAGATPTTEIDDAYATSFIKVNGTPVAATLTKVSGTYVYTLSGFSANGTYVVSIDGNIVQNKEGNKLAASTQTFKVAIPNLTNASAELSVSPTLMANAGGNATLTVKGTNIKDNLTAGNMTVYVKMTKPDTTVTTLNLTATNFTAGTPDTGTYVVAIPGNGTAATQTYTFTLHYTVNGGAEQDGVSTPACTVKVEPALDKIMTVTNGTVTTTDLIYNYPADTTATGSKAAGRLQTFTIKNNGAQNLTINSLTLTGPDGTKFANSAAGTTSLAAGATTTVTVWLQAGQNAGNYAGGPAGSETRLKVDATQANSTALSKSADVVKQTVVAASTGTTGNGEVTASVQPSSSWKNYASVTLTAQAKGTGNTVTNWKYAVTTSATAPASGDSAWVDVNGGVLTATHNFPATVDTTYYIHWKLNTKNYLNIAGTIIDSGVQTYKIDLTKPQVSSITANNTVIGNGPLDVEIVFDEKDIVSTLTASGLTLTNCSFVSASAPVNVDSTTKYIVTIQANSGLNAGDVVKLAVKAGAIQDKATNPNLASDASIEMQINYSTTSPTADYSFANNKLFAVAPGAGEIQITLTSNGVLEKKLYKAGTTPTNEIDQAYASSFIKVNGAPATITGMVPDTTMGTYTYTLGGFSADNTYVVSIAGDIVQNREGNKLAASTRTFKVAKPNLETGSAELSVAPTLMASAGGNATLTVKGTDIKNNMDAGNMTVYVKMTKPDSTVETLNLTAANFTSGSPDVGTFSPVVIPANTTTAVQTYSFKLFYTVNGGAEKDSGKTCELKVEPDASHIMTVVNGTSSPTDLEFGYPEDNTATGSKETGRIQTFTITNKGAQTLTITSLSLIGTDSAKFDHSTASSTTLAAGGTATVTVWLKAGQNAGDYAGTGAETKLQVNAKQANNATLTNSAALVKQTVDQAAGNITKGEVTANVQPSNDWKNYASVTLTAQAKETGDTVKEWTYIVTTSLSDPGGHTIVTGGVTTATHTFPADPDTTYYIYWTLTTNNYTGGMSGTITNSGVTTYKIDLTNPIITKITPKNSVIGNGSLDITIRFEDLDLVSPLTASGLNLTNCTFVSASGPTIVPEDNSDLQNIDPEHTEYIVTIKVAPGTPSGAVVGLAVNGGAVKDKATNPNLASDASKNLGLTYTTSSPEVISYSFTEGQEYPAAQTSVSLVIKANGATIANQDLYSSGTALAVGDSAPFVTVNDHGIGGSYTATITDITSGNVTITITGSFGTGDYTVSVAPGGITNFEGNLLQASSRTVKVRIPKITPPTVPGEENGVSFKMSPDLLMPDGGNSTATVYGENLQFAGTLEIEDPNGTPTRQTMVVAPDGKTATYVAALPPNYGATGVPYLFEVYLDGTLHNAKGKVVVQAAVPMIHNLEAHLSSGNVVLPLILDNNGGTVDLTIAGYSLQSFSLLEIKQAGNTYDVTTAASNRVGSISHTGVTLPPNLGATDIDYVFEVYANGAATGTTVTVTVQGSYPSVKKLSFAQEKFSAAGGASTATIDGIYLDNLINLVVRDLTNNIDLPVTVSADPNRTTATTATVSFPAWIPEDRNNLYDFEVYVDGNPTGVKAQVEVGDSIPNYKSVDANPNYFPDVQSTLYGKGKSVVTLHGNYLFNFATLELRDNVYNKMLPFTTVGDMTATQTVTVPSADGVYYYDVFVDGADTGLQAVINVGVALGSSGPEDLEPDTPADKLDHNDNKHWVSRGGGSKGRGFTGRNFVGFDLLEYQCEQEAKANPKDPIVIVPDVYYITRAQLDLAANGARRGARDSAKTGDGYITLWFDTSWTEKPEELEGRLHISLYKPIPDLHPGVFVDEKETKEAKDLFRTRFDNKNLAVVSLGQHGKYGDRVEIAADVDLKDFNQKTLCFYRFDRVTGEYAQMTKTDHYIDPSGYLHFFTELGDEIIITDSPLKQESGSCPVIKES